jgi:hypothetical protein
MMEMTIVQSFIQPSNILIHDIQQQDLAINGRWDINECQPSNDLNIHSLDPLVPPIFMMEEHKIREQLDALNPTLSPPTINLEEAYDFSSLLFSPPQISIEQSEQTTEPINSPTLPETSNQINKCRG